MSAELPKTTYLTRFRAQHKRERILATKPQPYPVGVPRTRTLREIRDAYIGLLPGAVTGERVTVTGRVISRRDTDAYSALVVQQERFEA